MCLLEIVKKLDLMLPFVSINTFGIFFVKKPLIFYYDCIHDALMGRPMLLHMYILLRITYVHIIYVITLILLQKYDIIG